MQASKLAFPAVAPMVSRRRLLAALCMAGCAPAWAALPPVVDGTPLPSLAPMLEQVTPSVVSIVAQGGNQEVAGFGRMPGRGRQNSSGSGVIVDGAQGYVLTNHHVVRGAQSIQITLQDGRTLPAQVLGSDPDTDIAVLRVQADRLQALPLADSSGVRVGDFVVAIGNPFGLGQSVSSGIVSALDRSSLRAAGYQNFIQTDASINPGNSGGALVNLRGELVGINTMIYTPSGGNVGLGFAIPSNLAGDVMRQLLAHGRVLRGTLGLDVLDLTPALARQLGLAPNATGVVVTRISDGTPAQQAGVLARDVIVALDGKPISTSQQLHNAEGLLPVGQQVRLTLRRAGRQMEVTLRIEPERDERLHAGSLDPRLNGVEFAEMPLAQRRQGNDGLLVTSTYPGRSPAASNLRRGDILIGINQRPVSRLGDLRNLLDLLDGQPMLLTLIRGRGIFYMQVR
ncbi:trypsin-like peptidase domain-containing protein [Bordetella genomosp. 13]|nr:trypsin-like peptidase domain-containing protein [Bordetella genomosp. 13]